MGSRGDVLMPTHVLLQVHDELRTIVNAGKQPNTYWIFLNQNN